MFEKILIPLDGSPFSERIVETLEPFIASPGTETLLARVVTSSAGHEGEAAEARRYLDRLVARFPGASVTGHVLEGARAADEIAAFEKRVRPSLIAMTTHGRTGLRRLVLGSVAERVVRTAKAPVLLANPELREVPLKIRRVLVPLDGSGDSATVLPLVKELAGSFHPEVIIVHVEALSGLDSQIAVADARRLSVETVERAEEQLEGVTVRAVVKTGLVAPLVLDAIYETQPDLVVIATHGREGLARAALGSVAEELVRRAPCPVLIRRFAPAEAGAKR